MVTKIASFLVVQAGGGDDDCGSDSDSDRDHKLAGAIWGGGGDDCGSDDEQTRVNLDGRKKGSTDIAKLDYKKELSLQ
jgi:hypothetical protein